MKQIRTALGTWSRDRSLASSRRAGQHERTRALEIQARFVRANRRTLLVGVAIGATAALPMLLFGGQARWFFLGAYVAGFVGLVWHWVIVASGSVNQVVGDLGEQWTHQELRLLRHRGWKTAHQVSFWADRDIDTVAIGPGGVVVVETKWASKPWSDPSQRRWIDDAALQVRRNADTTRVLLQKAIGRISVRSLVVLWPADERLARSSSADVEVLSGGDLRAWLEELPSHALTAEQIERGWHCLADQIRIRDDFELERLEPPTRSPTRYLLDIGAYPLGGLISLYIGLAGYQVATGAAGLVVEGIVLFAAIGLTRVEATRRWAVGGALTLAGFWLAVGVLTLAQ